MKLHSRKYVCLFVVIGFLVSPLYAYAQSQNRHFRSDKTWQENKETKNKENRRAEIYKQLNLSSEQAEKLQALRNTHRERATQFHTKIKVKKEELKKELQKHELNMERIDQLHSEVKTILGQREDDRLKKILDVRQILTPEQLEKFLELDGNFHRKAKSRKKNRKK